MIVSTFNCRGLGGRVKRNKIKELICSQNLDFIAIQETKMETISDSFCHYLWGSTDCDWAFQPSVGNSGGILSLWRKSSARLILSVVEEGFVGVCLDFGVLHKRCFVVNVYSKCDLSAKRRLWENLLLLKGGLGDGAWCFLGDFNAVCNVEERRGVNVDSEVSSRLERNLFNNFIRELEVEDINILGRKFTWYHPNGIAMNRIDRVFVSEGWSLAWGIGALWVLPRDVSDHCPLVLKGMVGEWGPKPFRFNNFWIENRKFKRVVEEAWRGSNATGWMGFVLKTKLKELKLVLKAWHLEEYGGLDLKLKVLMKDIADLDLRGEIGLLNPQEVELRKSKFGELWRLLASKDALV